jgi:hypothetical protein
MESGVAQFLAGHNSEAGTFVTVPIHQPATDLLPVLAHYYNQEHGKMTSGGVEAEGSPI